MTAAGEGGSNIIWLKGSTAGLGPFEQGLVGHYWRWENEPRVLLGYGHQYPSPVATRSAVFDGQSQSGMPYFTVYDVTESDPVPVGISSLLTDDRTRTGEFSVALGEGGRRRSIGLEAARLTVDYGLHITNLRNIFVSILEPNVVAIRCCERVGFRKVGVRRNSGWWLGEIVDHVLMDLVPEEFIGPSVVKNSLGG